MKLKYYLRGLGIGIIVTTIILMISFAGHKEELSDEEIIARAAQLGMVMPEDTETDTQDMESTENFETEEDESQTAAQSDADTAQDGEADAQPDADTAEDGEPDSSAEDASANSSSEENDSVKPYLLTIQRGDVCRTVCEKLAENGIVDDAEALRKYLFGEGVSSNISVGSYEIPYGSTFEQIAEILKAGPLEKQE